MIRPPIVLVLAVLSLGQTPPGGQPPVPASPGTPAPAAPARDPLAGRDPQRGTAVLRGTIVSADTRTALRRALVRATSQDGRGGGVATTDAEGRFEITELPAGRYTVSANKAGYVSSTFGQRRPETPGTVLDVLDGQIVEKIVIALPRGGVLTGRVTDEYGEPIAFAQVQAQRYRYINGARRLMPSGGGTSNDLGEFRVFGLLPGEYYVSATARSDASMPMMNVAAAGTGEVEGFAPTFYPGTTNAAEAMRVTVRVGQETGGLNFALIPTRLVRVSGRLLSASGQPMTGAFVNLRPDDRLGGATFGFGFFTAQTRPDGTFQFNAVPAGNYVLTSQPMGRPVADAEYGQTRISVGSDDVVNVIVTAARGAVARGVIRSDDAEPLPLRPPQVSVFARPADGELTVAIGGTEPKVNDDWTFELGGLFNRRTLGAGVMGDPAWALKAVYLDGIDVTDQAIDFVPGTTMDGFEIVVTRRITTLSGVVTDGRGQPVLDASVVAFPQDASRWTPTSRFIRVARPDQSGRFELRGLPPSEYFLIALQDLEPGRQNDPEFLESVRTAATRVSLEEAETRVQNLRLAATPP